MRQECSSREDARTLTPDAFPVGQPYGLHLVVAVERCPVYPFKSIPRRIRTEENIELSNKVILALCFCHVPPRLLCLVPQEALFTARADRSFDALPPRSGGCRALRQDEEVGDERDVMSPCAPVVYVLRRHQQQSSLGASRDVVNDVGECGRTRLL